MMDNKRIIFFFFQEKSWTFPVKFHTNEFLTLHFWRMRLTDLNDSIR